MEIIFTDLIAKSYLIYTKNNDNDIAHLYYKEQVKVKEGNNKDFFSKKEFYNKLISQIQALINGSIYTFTNDSIYKRGPYDISNIPKESRDEYYFEMDHMYIKEKNNFYDFEAPGFNISNWEECEDAYILKECIYFQLVTLKDPVAFIDPSDSISKETLVLRKSKLEHLKSEAERASKVTSIDELDSTNISSGAINLDNPIDSMLQREDIQEGYVSKALEIIKPLGGIYIMDNLLDEINMKRLNDYIRSIIMTGYLPLDLSPFPKLAVPAQFIRKTIHLVFLSIEKNYTSEFINLICLFENFKGSTKSTIYGKFSSYEGTYDKVLAKISY
ncbi:MAG: hypothetical protein ACI93P_002425 [bacterium]|jgi:hypothetical protein